MDYKGFKSIRPWKLSAASSSHLNMARSLAAVAVAGGHVRKLFWVDYANVTDPNPALAVVYFLTGLGHEAVLVFFVLSGFFISATVFRSGLERWSVQSYAIDRLSRLYIVLLPALILGGLLDSTTRRLPGGQAYFFHAIDHFGPAFEGSFTVKAFVGNLSFLQDSLVRPFGSNGPLWSLANEFWYYAFWALLCLVLCGLTLRRRLIAGLLLVLCFLGISKSIWLLLPVWLMGASVHGLSRAKCLSKRGPKVTAFVAATILFGTIVYLSKKQLLWGLEDYCVGIAFTVLLYAAIQSDFGLSDRYGGVSKFFADFSFSLYVTHFPVLILLRTLMWKRPPFQPALSSGFILFLLLGTVLLIGYLFSLGTEAFTSSVRTRLHALFSPRLKPSDQAIFVRTTVEHSIETVS
jgi:peptidoglycan/LPS O-acetylase OafA/YrhL